MLTIGANTPASPSCRDVTSQPTAYIGTKVSVLAVKHLVSSALVDGKTVVVQIYSCSDARGSVAEDDEYFFALDPRAAVGEAAAANSVAHRITGVVQAALEVPLPKGRFQVKRVMPFLTGVTINVP